MLCRHEEALVELEKSVILATGMRTFSGWFEVTLLWRNLEAVQIGSNVKHASACGNILSSAKRACLSCGFVAFCRGTHYTGGY